MTDSTLNHEASAEHVLARLPAGLKSMDQLIDYLDQLVHIVREVTPGCDEVGITVLPDNRPRTVAYTTIETLAIDAVQYALDEGPCLDAARHHRENLVDMATAHERWPQFAEHVREDGIRSLMAFPLTDSTTGESLGALNLYAYAPGAFAELDARLVRILATRCAETLASLFALDDAQRLAGQLEQAMANRAVIEQAKGALMAIRGIDEHAAFEVLRQWSQDHNIKVRDLAAQFLASMQDNSTPTRPNPPNGAGELDDGSVE